MKGELGREAGDYRFPSDIDKLGRLKGEESYVAVVHADGNRMGEHLDETIKDSKDNRACIHALRDFSTRINQAGLMALHKVVKLARQAADQELVPIVTEKNVHYLPLRPLVFGGDDVTFVCNAQLGLSLTAAYLEEFEKATTELGLKGYYASAGVAMVKMHYPFARAYTLSNDLTDSAKRLVRNEAGGDCSALDWHFATGGLSGSIKVIREREFQDGLLLMRPLLLRKKETVKGRYWKGGVEEVIRQFREEKPWKDSHNKVVGLRDPLRAGVKDMEAYLRDYDLEGKLPLPVDEEAQKTGWSGGRCAYFDAVELLDHHISLTENKKEPA